MKKVAGLHISGSNSKKTAVAIFTIQDEKFTSLKLYEKIGSFGSVFSEERIKHILDFEKDLAGVYFDCPLYLSPCLECVRPYCPGVIGCDDVGVATLLSKVIQDKRQGAKHLRPLNPQSSRVWDVVIGKNLIPESTFSPSVATLTHRARTIIKMFSADFAPETFKEVSVPHALAVFFTADLAEKKDFQAYKNFEQGAKVRARIIKKLAEKQILDERSCEIFLNSNYVESFQAVLTAVIGGMDILGRSEPIPANFLPVKDWVVLPKFTP